MSRVQNVKDGVASAEVRVCVCVARPSVCRRPPRHAHAIVPNAGTSGENTCSMKAQ